MPDARLFLGADPFMNDAVDLDQIPARSWRLETNYWPSSTGRGWCAMRRLVALVDGVWVLTKRPQLGRRGVWLREGGW